MPLSKVAKVVVQFSPWTGEARAAREFFTRITSEKARKSNPECVVEAKVRISGQPRIFVEYANKEQEMIIAIGITAPEIVEKIRSHSQDGDTRALLQKAGLEGTKLETHWGSSRRHNPGTAQKVPIT